MSMSLLSVVFGGVLLGLASAALLLLNGRIAGNSGIIGGLLTASTGDLTWRWAWITGLISGGVILLAARPASFEVSDVPSLPVLVVAGLLVGVGTRLANGCTSGHGLCGSGRLSVRSMVATCVFCAVAATTVAILRFAVGG